MTTVEIKVNLPDQVALEAQQAGLLSDQAIGRLIEEAVQREAGKRLLDANEQRLTQAATRASQASFAAVWNNDEDAAYDRM